MRPTTSCMCSYVNSIETNTLFVILIHPMEFKKEKNGTGILTHLQLKNSKLIIGVNFSKDKEVNDILSDPEIEPYILYPGSESINLSDPNTSLPRTNKRKVIFIIDGTWPCAKKMLRLSTNLHGIPKISFENHKLSKFLLKQQPNPACLSTIESTHLLLDLLNQKNVESVNLDPFLLPFKKMIDYQIECIENPPSHSYRSTGKGRVNKKDMYKANNGRKLFFDETEYKKHKFLQKL